VHQLTDGRYLMQVGSQNLPFPAADIEAIKRSRLQRATEMQFLPDASLEALNLNLLEELARRSGISPSPMEAPLVRLVGEAFKAIQLYIPARQPLVDLFSEERFAYPTFAWQEAIVNAVAHRDYRLGGLGIEVHLFDDRMEIGSLGELVEPVTLERLCRGERVHASQNPRIVRVLTAFGYMRELGEGIPRMFEVMEREGLRPPKFQLEGGRFVVTLYSTPIYRPETMRWLRRFEGQGLTRNQIRLFAYAYEHGGRFTSRTHQKLVGVDLYTTSRDIKDLIRRRIVRLTQPRGRVYEIIPEPQKATVEKPAELEGLEPILKEKG